MKSRTMVPLALSALLWVLPLAPSARADEWDKLTTVTFNQPVEIPGHVLAPGEYVIKLADLQANRDVVEFFTKDQKQIVATVIAIPTEREDPADKTIITFEERAKNAPEAIHTWYYPGDTTGYEFVYPEVHPVQLASTASQPALSPTRAAAQPAAHPQPPVKSVPPMMAMNKPNPVKQNKPVQMAQAATPPVAPQPAAKPAEHKAKLPHTASNLPLLGLLGLISLGLGSVLAIVRRRQIELG